MIKEDYSKGNKRIAKNTLVIYGQLILKMFLGLFTSRLALEALGVSDFGLNSVVGGVVVLFTFISESLSGTTIRFINVERGKPDGDLNRVFNVCNVLHIVMAIFLFVLLEVGGVYYIYHYLNVDSGKEADAMFVFQVSTIVCCIGIINVPFASLFNASEKFLFVAIVEISVKIVQLILLIWLLTYEGNRIKAFALIETLATSASFLVYHYYAYRRWSEVIKWRFIRESKIYKRMLIFSSFNLFSAFAWIGKVQGSQLLINFFFGTVVNGAYAVARTIEGLTCQFANNLQSSASPQIIQSYSSGDVERVFYLTTRVGKYCLLMMTIAIFPLWSELDFILHLWLIKVPEGTLVFCRLVLLMVMVAITDGSLTQVINASGKVGRFTMAYSILNTLCIPIGYIVLKAGCPAYMLLVLFLVADIIYRIVQFYMIHTILHFPILRFCRKVFLPVIKTIIPIMLCLFMTTQIQINSPLWRIFHIFLVFLLSVCSAYYLGLHENEREKIVLSVTQRIRKSI
jgi:O-antigen/teichoic acid export membrane protein